MMPEAEAPGGHEIELVGDLTGILLLAEADMTKPPRITRAGSGAMVAGACNHLKLRLLSAYRALLEQSALAWSRGLLRSAA